MGSYGGGYTMSKNDETILILKNKINEEKEKLTSANSKFIPFTNCSLDFRGNRYNLNTLDLSQVDYLLVELTALLMAADFLNMPDFSISGFPLHEWITDLQNRKEVMLIKERERKLKSNEAKLECLLSDEKKTELEISKIAESLGL